MQEPKAKQGKCDYCADAYVPHALSYFEGLVSVLLDSRAGSLTRHAPDFLKKFVDLIPIFMFHFFAFFGLAKFSTDVEKAKNFRSKLIWEEAVRRGIQMEQVILWGRPLDFYRAKIGGKWHYFESIPMPPEYSEMSQNWDDKIILKTEFLKAGVPVPKHFKLPFSFSGAKKIFETMQKPVIVKPRVGSRGRHTVTNIRDTSGLEAGIKIAGQICPHLVMEEHLEGYVCRATLVGGELAGFYRGIHPRILGDGKKTIRELILEKDKNRPERVESVRITQELTDHIARSRFALDDILPSGEVLTLSHRIGRLFGGATKEMLPELHPSFVPILKNAQQVTGLSVVGFDAIIPDPEKDALSQKWGIIEGNTLPFIDLHYFALEGKPQNIAGMIWDLWKK